MYDNWLFFPPFLFPPKKDERRKEELISKTGFKQVFLVIHSIFFFIFYKVDKMLHLFPISDFIFTARS